MQFNDNSEVACFYWATLYILVHLFPVHSFPISVVRPIFQFIRSRGHAVVDMEWCVSRGKKNRFFLLTKSFRRMCLHWSDCRCCDCSVGTSVLSWVFFRVWNFQWFSWRELTVFCDVTVTVRPCVSYYIDKDYRFRSIGMFGYWLHILSSDFCPIYKESYDYHKFVLSSIILRLDSRTLRQLVPIFYTTKSRFFVCHRRLLFYPLFVQNNALSQFYDLKR